VTPYLAIFVPGTEDNYSVDQLLIEVPFFEVSTSMAKQGQTGLKIVPILRIRFGGVAEGELNLPALAEWLTIFRSLRKRLRLFS
jgi:hypothetical protein